MNFYVVVITTPHPEHREHVFTVASADEESAVKQSTDELIVLDQTPGQIDCFCVWDASEDGPLTDHQIELLQCKMDGLVAEKELIRSGKRPSEHGGNA